MALIYMLQ